MTIQRLEESVIVRIAAGEVIERPASVVKELVENSLDAGATEISVRVERGGLGLIEVSDNGSGIPPGELELAIERHATSKLSAANDLTAIETLGFRGEALATIAAVGRLTIVSRIEGADAMQLKCEGGGVILEPVGRGIGTTVIVRDLFCRTPARLKFMKSETAEFSRVSEMLERIAIAHPSVAIEMIRDGRKAFRTPGKGDLRATVAEIFGHELAREMVDLDATSGSRSIRGLISPTHITRKNRSRIWLSLMGRPFEDKSLLHAVTSAYGGVIPGGTFPIVFLRLDVSPREVDVNVHPAKAEVRFQDPSAAHSLVSRAIRSRLQGDSPLPRILLGVDRDYPFSPSDRARQAVLPALFAPSIETEQAASRESITKSVSATSDLRRGSAAPLHSEPSTQHREAVERSLRLSYAGEIAGRYVLAEDDDGLVILDQHAAHERVLFDELMRQAQNGDVVVSPLMIPITIEAGASERALVEDRKSFFEDLGFEIEIWPDSIAIRAVPAVLSQTDVLRLFREIMDALQEGSSAKPSPVPYARLAMEACKSAVKGRSRLEPAEANELLRDLVRTTDPYNCPHGRPTMIRLTISELDRRFGRT